MAEDFSRVQVNIEPLVEELVLAEPQVLSELVL